MNVFNTCCIITTSLCNLHCSYCFIHNRSADSIKADIFFKEALEDDYYVELSKKIHPDPTHYKELQFWGGEPCLFPDRILRAATVMCSYYTSIDEFYVPTNFTQPDMGSGLIDAIIGISEIVDRDFKFKVQISLDGPDEILGETRGVTSDRIIANLKQFCNRSKELPEHCTLVLAFKPTVDINLFKKKFVSYEFQKQYFDFYDKAILSLIPPNIIKGMHLEFSIADPYKCTIEDGQRYAQALEITRQLDVERKEAARFGHLRRFFPKGGQYVNLLTSTTPFIGRYCYPFVHRDVLFPLGYIGGCHREIDNFVAIIGGEVPQSTLLTKIEDYPKVYQSWVYSGCPNSKWMALPDIPIIQFLAMTGQILPEYAEEANARRAALSLTKLGMPQGCPSRNYVSTNSISCHELGGFRLMLNGALSVYEKHYGIRQS